MNKPQQQTLDTTRPWSFYQTLIASDRHGAPSDVLKPSHHDLGVADSERGMYTDPAFHRLELQRLWPRVWQFACRAEEIPEPGDILVYELGDWSFLIVRGQDGAIKAFRNSCTHRGTKLCASNTHLQQIRCPFHGFAWKLDGSLDEVPGRWDFPQVGDDSHRLTEVRLGEWGGFVFITLDDQAPALDTYLEDLPEHLAACRFEDLYIHGYYRKTLPANWKGSIEAFLEAYHGTETHSQTIGFTNDRNTQYDIFPGRRHTSRFLQPIGVASPSLSTAPSEQEIVDSMFETVMRAPEAAPRLPDGVSARQFLADVTRAQLSDAGRDVGAQSDAELLDAIQYSLFPNMVLFRSVGFPVVYRFRPHKHDPDSCIFDMYILRPVPEGEPRPFPAEMVEMGDMRYAQIPELAPWLGDIYDQDVGNLALLQEGLKADTRPVTLSHYQESRIRHFHQTLRSYLERP